MHGDGRTFRTFSPQIQLTPEASKQIAETELQRVIDQKQQQISGLQKQVLALQEALALVRAR
jgi:ABC-type sulfate/molybdate transport systems ATPase subunit